MSADTMDATTETTPVDDDVTVEATAAEPAVAETPAVDTTDADTTDETTVAEDEGPVETPATIAELQPKMQLTGTVKRLELYGAFIDLGNGITGLIHISKLGGDQVNRVSDVLKEGDEVHVWVEKVDPERQQVMLTMVPPLAVDWTELKTDQVYTGKVTRLENFGAFVDIGAEREGLVHISELSHDYVKQPSEVVRVGDEVQVKVLSFNRRKRRIDLSMKALLEKTESEAVYTREPRSGGGRGRGGQNRAPEPREDFVIEDDEPEEMLTAMEIAMRQALGNDVVSSVKSDQRGGKGKQKKQRREEQRQLQEELLKRTLTMSSDN